MAGRAIVLLALASALAALLVGGCGAVPLPLPPGGATPTPTPPAELDIVEVSVTPAELPFSGGEVAISAVVLGNPTEVWATVSSPSGGEARVELAPAGENSFAGQYLALPNPNPNPAVYSVAVGARAGQRTARRENAATFSVRGVQEPPSAPSF